MVYPIPFYRLVMSGDLYAEKWATSISLLGGDLTPVDTELLDAVAGECIKYIAGTTPYASQFSINTRLTEVKLNRIGTDGKYADPDSMTKFGSPLAVGPNPTNGAPQLAPVVTLRTAFERGRANRGRMYLPPHFGYITVGADGRALASNAVTIASETTRLFNNIKTVWTTWLGGGDLGAHPVVMSDIGAGTWHSVTRMEVGRVVDTMRSRRSSLDEDYQASTIAPTW